MKKIIMFWMACTILVVTSCAGRVTVKDRGRPRPVVREKTVIRVP